MIALRKITSSGRSFSKLNVVQNAFISSSAICPVKVSIGQRPNIWVPPTLNLKCQLAHRYFADPIASVNTVPIIILHGILDSKSSWNLTSWSLSEKTFRTIIAVDARNHGDSPHIEKLNYEDMVRDLVYLLQNHDIAKASFIGHGMGGRTVMMLAQLYPELVHSMAIVDISPVGLSPTMTGMSKVLRRLKTMKLSRRLTLAEAQGRAIQKLSTLKLDPNLMNTIVSNLVENEPMSNWQWLFNIEAIAENFETEICRFPIMRTDVDTRTLFISGMNSDYIRREDESRIKSIFPRAEFKYIVGAGHWVQIDRPHPFIGSLTAFFNNETYYYSNSDQNMLDGF